MKQTKDQQIENLTVEFKKLLIMLHSKFPEAYYYWKQHLKYTNKVRR